MNADTEIARDALDAFAAKDREIARLRAELKTAWRLLASVEWAAAEPDTHGIIHAMCPVCIEYKEDGHIRGCALDKWLRENDGSASSE